MSGGTGATGHSPVSIPYDAPLNQAAQAIAERLQGQSAIRNPHWLAIQLLEGDVTVRNRVPADALVFADAQVTRLVAEYEDELDIFLADALSVCGGGGPRGDYPARRSFGHCDRQDRPHCAAPFFGIPIFLLVMYLMFVFTINVGSAFIDFFDKLFGTLLVEGFGELLLALHTGMVENLAGGWRGRRYSDRVHLYSGDRLSVSVPVMAGRLRLHGAGGVCDGPIHAQHRFAG